MLTSASDSDTTLSPLFNTNGNHTKGKAIKEKGSGGRTGLVAAEHGACCSRTGLVVAERGLL